MMHFGNGDKANG